MTSSYVILWLFVIVPLAALLWTIVALLCWYMWKSR